MEVCEKLFKFLDEKGFEIDRIGYPVTGEKFVNTCNNIVKVSYDEEVPRIIVKKKRWRANRDGIYLRINADNNGVLVVWETTETMCEFDNDHFNSGNYFHPYYMEEIQARADKANAIIRGDV